MTVSDEKWDLDAQRHFVEHLINKGGLVRDEKPGVMILRTLGDFYCLCRGLYAAEQHTQRRYVVFYYKEQQKAIAEWFSYDGYEIELCRLTQDEVNHVMKISREIRAEYSDYLLHFGGEGTFYEYTCNLNPIFGSELRMPKINPVPEELIRRFQLRQNKSVLIIPGSQTVMPFPKWYWNMTAETYRQLGYDVIFNADEGQYDGKSALFDISDFISLADYCGYVIGVRCGLFDILSTSTARMTIYSTEFYKPIDELYSIPNGDGRIRTVYYEDKDPYFEKTAPYCLAENHFREASKGLQDMCRAMAGSVDAEGIGISAEMRAYRFVNPFGRVSYAGGDEIVPQIEDLSYRMVIRNGAAWCFLSDVDITERFRIDVSVFMNGNNTAEINDCPVSTICYPISSGGKVFFEIRLTNKADKAVNVFRTNEVTFGDT